MATRTRVNSLNIYRVNITVPPDFASLVLRALPLQGCVEVQRDQAGKKHDWHKHKTDETIIVIGGSLLFYWEQSQRFCEKGDVIFIPAGEPHRSEAQSAGPIYIIAFQLVDI